MAMKTSEIVAMLTGYDILSMSDKFKMPHDIRKWKNLHEYDEKFHNNDSGMQCRA